MLVDLSDGFRDWGQQRIKKSFYGVGGGKFPIRGHSSVLAPLTSPIPYLHNLPSDPFYYQYVKAAHLSLLEDELTVLPLHYYHYEDNDPVDKSRREVAGQVLLRRFETVPRIQEDWIQLNEGEYYIWGQGPKHIHNAGEEENPYYYNTRVTYAITNGVISDGVLIFLSAEGILQ